MYHIYLLVSLFSVVSSDPLSFMDVRSTQEDDANNPINMEVQFDSLPQVNVGDPVLFNGSLVGNVSSVNFSKDLVNSGAQNVALDNPSLNNSGPSFNNIGENKASLSSVSENGAEYNISSVSIRVNSRDLPPTEQLFVLASSLKVVNGKTPGARSFMELMKLQAPVAEASSISGAGSVGPANKDITLKGFSSFEEFWRGGAQ